MEEIGKKGIIVDHVDSTNPKLWKNFVAGGVGGTFLIFAGHPFDTMKVRLQTAYKTPQKDAVSQLVGSRSQSHSYSGALDCFKSTWRREGISGFYKGMGAPLLTVIPLFSVGFYGYAVGKIIVGYFTPPSPSNKIDEGTTTGMSMSPFQLFLAGAISACFTSFLITPVERIKCLLQVQSNSLKYSGPLQCGVALLKEGGVRNLYRGWGATVSRGIPQAGLYYMTYDVLKMNMGDGKPLSISQTLLAGGLTGIINWSLILPLDVVKSRVQTAPKDQFPRGARDVWVQILKTEGLKGYYRGAVPVLLRAFPANAACFLGFESTMKLMNYIGI